MRAVMSKQLYLHVTTWFCNRARCQVQLCLNERRKNDVNVVGGHRQVISKVLSFDINVIQRVSAVYLLTSTAHQYFCDCGTARPHESLVYIAFAFRTVSG